MAIDPHEMAKTELANAMVPTPEDMAEMLSPIAMLYLLEQMAWATLTTWTAYLSDEQGADEEVASDAAETLQGLTLTVGELDGVCARIGVIPAESVPPGS